jgi:pyruvate/2-oxoglutarate/acetoin dehydrogenase E1 component
VTLKPGHDVTLIASGGPVFNALEAARKLEADGISAEVINAASIKPLESGDPRGLYAKHGLDQAGIAASVRKSLGR